MPSPRLVLISVFALCVLLAGCKDDPVSAGSDVDPIPEFIPESIDADLTASVKNGRAGYDTEIRAYCVARGTNPGIEQFYVRSEDEGSINQSFTHPADDSLSIILTLNVVRRHSLVMRCTGRGGDTIEKTVILDGQRPEVTITEFGQSALVEDTGSEFPLPEETVSSAETVEVISPIGVSVQLNDNANGRTISFRPYNGFNGPFTFALVATNGFGTTEIAVPGRVQPVTDLSYSFRVAGTTSPATVAIELFDASNQLISSRNHPPVVSGWQIDELEEEISARVEASSGVFFPMTQRHDASKGTDWVIQSTLHQQQFCRSVFQSSPNPLESCRAAVGESLFTSTDAGHGYRPYPLGPFGFILMTNPETGESLSEAWRTALEQAVLGLVAEDIYFYVRDNVGDTPYERETNGRLTFASGSWIYPRTDSEGVNRTDIHLGNDLLGNDLIKSASMALDPNSTPPPSDELTALLLATVFGVSQGDLWHSMAPGQQKSYATTVIAPFRFDDRTAWALPTGAVLDDVMGKVGQ